jgi:hypothetical protein
MPSVSAGGETGKHVVKCLWREDIIVSGGLGVNEMLLVGSKMKCLILSVSQTRSDVTLHQFQSFIISLFLDVCDLSVRFVQYSTAAAHTVLLLHTQHCCCTYINETHQNVCLI